MLPPAARKVTSRTLRLPLAIAAWTRWSMTKYESQSERPVVIQ